MTLLHLYLLAVALQIPLRALASPSPAPNLNNIRFQFNINDNYGGKGRKDPSEARAGEMNDSGKGKGTPPAAPIVTHTVTEVARVTIFVDPDEEETAPVAGDKPDDPNVVAEEILAPAADPNFGGDDMDPSDSVLEVVDTEDTADTADTTDTSEQNSEAPLPFDENLYSTNPELASEEVKIKKVEQEIIYSYLQKRNELCPICFAMVSRHGEARISEYQYKEVLNSETWLFASGISETLSLLGYNSRTSIPVQTAKSICNKLVPQEFRRRIERSITRTKSLVKMNTLRELETTKAERRFEAYQRLKSSMNERLEDFRCNDDFTDEVAYIRGLLEQIA